MYNGKKAIRIIGIILLSGAGLTAIVAAGNASLSLIEKKLNPAPGKMIDVDGKKIHVYSEGTGSNKVLLWSGLGTPCPVIDFKPLIKELAVDHTVIVVENFGYGWSDWTDKTRSSENIVEETREALVKAGFQPPYSIIAHSISGSYALYYSIMHPQEVSAILCEDADVPAINRYVMPMKPSYAINIFRKLGVVRLATKISPSLARLPGNASGHYTKNDYKLLRLMTCWNAWNKTIIGESRIEGLNIDEFSDRKYSRAIPVKMLVSQEVTDFVKKAGWGIDWVSLHEMALEDDTDKNVIIMQGGHYIHWENSKRIMELLEGMLDASH